MKETAYSSEENIKRRISMAEIEFKMMAYKTMVAKSHQESMALAERAHEKELALKALEEELRNSR